jgi:hypothetical protein
MNPLEKLSTLTLDIATEQQNLTALRDQFAIALKSYNDWDFYATKSCTGLASAKRKCEETKNNHYKPQAATALNNLNAVKALLLASEARLKALKAEQVTNQEAQTAINSQTVTLAGQGLTYKAVETAAEAEAQSKILKTQQEVDAKAAADQKALDQKANRNRLFLIFGIFLFLVIVILIIRKLRKKKTSKP